MKNLKVLVIIVLITILLTSCSGLFPKPVEPTGAIPNLTLTALFDTDLNIPPTITPPAANLPTAELPTLNAPTAAPTYTNTNTAIAPVIPTSTANPPTATMEYKQRSGNQMKAGYLNDAPVMDGTYEEWLEDSYKYKLPYVVWGSKEWKDSADLEGAFAAGWDDDYLYVSVKVTDDKYVQNATGAMMYEGDSIELLIDTNLLGDYYVQYLDNDDFQLGVSAGKMTTNIDENYLWYPSGSKGSKSKILMGSLFETDPIYRIEVGIPWSLLGVTPYNGMRLGYAVSINDNDDSTKNVQQSMLSTAQYRNFLNPTTWGELVLVK